MRKSTRVFIAISEIIGGLLLMIGFALAALTRVEVPALYLLVCESLAVMAIIAGYRLFQDRQEGFTLSLFLQGSQVVQLGLRNFLYRVTLGPYLVVILSWEKTLISPGFKGELTIGLKGPTSAAVGINLVAAILFFLLARAILHQRRRLGTPVANAEVIP
jgi:hypothetical protein